MGLLGEILTILNKVQRLIYFYPVSKVFEENFHLLQHLRDGDVGKILGVLGVLSQSSRFKLSLDFLSKSEKQAVSLCA